MKLGDLRRAVALRDQLADVDEFLRHLAIDEPKDMTLLTDTDGRWPLNLYFRNALGVLASALKDERAQLLDELREMGVDVDV